MIIGILMALETCLIFWQVSHSLLYWKKKLPNGHMWSGDRLTRKQLTSRPDHLWPERWEKMRKNAKLKERSISGQMRNSVLRTHENCEGSISLTLRIRNSRKPSRMLVRNWKHQLLLRCLARKVRKERPVERLMISGQNLRVSWKPVNPQDCVWKNLYPITMRTILQENGTSHCNIFFWYTNFFRCIKQWRYPQQKQQWMTNEKNLTRFRRGTWQESEVNQRWSMKQGRRAQQFILPHWWTFVIWRMPNWSLPRYANIAQIMVHYGRHSRFSWAKSVWSSFGRTVTGKAIWENPFEVRLGEGIQLLTRTPWKKVLLICVSGWHHIGWKETTY